MVFSATCRRLEADQFLEVYVEDVDVADPFAAVADRDDRFDYLYIVIDSSRFLGCERKCPVSDGKM